MALIANEIPELLFFDTFSHDNSDDLNLDLVQFPKPVFITEVRIIPLGARVEGLFTGGFRLGATNPSKFHVEFFVNDLGKPGASTFECLGNFEYNQNDCIHLECTPKEDHLRQIPTDGLVLRGWYHMITLAVYGTLTKGITEPIASPPPPPPPAIVPPPVIVPNVPSPIEKVIQDNHPVEWSSDELVVRPVTYETFDSNSKGSSSQGITPTATFYGGTESGSKDSPRSFPDRRVRSQSSDSDVDRELERKSTIHLGRRKSSRDLSTGYLSNSERDRDYLARKRSNNSPEYRHSRRTHTRSGSKSQDRSDSIERDRKRPRTPIMSPVGRPPLSPDQPRQRIIDHTMDDDREQTPTVITDEPSIELCSVTTTSDFITTSVVGTVDDETMSPQPEPFEPILSDDEIGDDETELYDDYEEDDNMTTEFDDSIKHFDPFSAKLDKFDGDAVTAAVLSIREVEITSKIIHKLQARDEKCSYKIFTAAKCSADTRKCWVHSVEHVAQVLGHIHNFTYERRVQALQQITGQHKAVLLQWLKIGLDLDCALSHSQPGYKIRHIKIGARLAELLGSYGPFIRYVLITSKFDLFQAIFNMYNQQHMALPIKLMLIRAMHACLDTPIAVDYFTSKKWYKKLIDVLDSNPLIRIKFALRALLKKLNLYESLRTIRDIVTHKFILNDTKSGDDESNSFELLDCHLKEVLIALTSDRISYTQPKRLLPVSTIFEFVTDTAANRNALASFQMYFRQHALLESILLLVANVPDCPSQIIEIGLDLLTALCNNGFGLEYLIDNLETTGVLVKVLLQVRQSDEDEAIMDYVIETRGQHLGAEIAYKIQTVYLLNAIQSSKIYSDELVDHIQALCLIMSDPLSRQHVIHTMSFNNNLKIILDLIDRERKADNTKQSLSTEVQTRSPALSYAIDIIDYIVRYGNRIGYLIDYGDALMNMVKNYELYDPTVATVLQEIAVYLRPLDLPNVFSYDDINPLFDVVKKNIDSIGKGCIGGDLITALRILRYLAVPYEDQYSNIPSTSKCTELRYEYVILKMYSAAGITTLCSVIERLNKHFEQPFLHTAMLASVQGQLILQILLPTIEIFRRMLIYVIRSRNIKFRDITAVEHLLNAYTLMYNVSAQSVSYTDACTIQKEIIQCLLAYSQPTPPDGVDTESVHRSLWTQMIGEVLRYIVFAPYTFLPGLTILSELLPLPLPVETNVELHDYEVTRLVTERQLWSAHLHPRSQLITDVIQTVCISGYQPLLQQAIRVCLQLADLAPNMALIVTKSVTEFMLLETTQPQHIQLLRFLALLVVYPPIKVCVLSILSGKLMDFLLTILTTPTSNPDSVEVVLSIVHTLCDADVTMLPNDIQQESTESFACSLPSKELLPIIIGSILDCFLSETTTITNQIFALRTLLLLVEYDYTVYHLQQLLDKKKELLVKKLDTLPENLTLIPIFLEFTQSLLCSKSGRSICLSTSELSALLNWTGLTNDEENLHPLIKVKNQLEQKVEDEDKLILNSLNDLLQQLNEIRSPTTELATDRPEPIFPQGEGIVTQYTSRPIFIVMKNGDPIGLEQYGSPLWPNRSSPLRTNDDFDNQSPIELIPCDLGEMIKTCLPRDTNISSDCKRLLHLSASPQAIRERTPTAPCFRTRRVEVEPTTGRPEKKIFVTRGRGFVRTPQTRADLFRSRLPNTSRPPSLHVDDFVALETCGAQPTGPTGYNKLCREMINIRGPRGGRGRGMFGVDRGRGGVLAGITGSPGGVYRQVGMRGMHRSGYPSSWMGSNLVGIGPMGSGGGGGSGGGLFRTGGSDPSHFQNEYGPSTSHFMRGGSGIIRGRSRGGRLPRHFPR